jgi:hypothetical protein
MVEAELVASARRDEHQARELVAISLARAQDHVLDHPKRGIIIVSLPAKPLCPTTTSNSS